MLDEQRRIIGQTRALDPGAVAVAAAARRRRPWLGSAGRLMIIAADHPARGVLAAGDRPMAMANRADLLDRILVALARPGVDGILGSADIIEDLLLLGALDGKVVLGSMNRGGLPGTAFEIDDRFTGYNAAAIGAAGLDGGKMLLRIDPGDPATANTLESCANAVTDLAQRGLVAIVEPFMVLAGHRGNDLSPDAVIKSIAIASGLGSTSAYTWLKIPVVEEMERVAAASTLPALLLGGDVGDKPDEMFDRWRRALSLPGIYGLVTGRNLLYPPDDDVAGAVDIAVSLL
ncbi:MAG TPA: aldolase [Streptosporangiaceae bacterium]|nr:aldolase [Streptosporangiaceae bacterium]